jgi:hypothetical protein
MGESKPRIVAASKRNEGTPVPICSPKSRFGVAARALWPRKTAAELALRAKVSERAAKFWLSGKREPSFDAVMVIVAEIRRGRPII